MYSPSSKNVFVNTLSCCKQGISRQEALRKAYYTQVLLTLDKLDLKITCKLLTKLAFVLETNSPKAFIVLTNSHVSLDLIDYIFTANKQSPSLKDKRAKAIKGN
jgi:hypothetical protein